MVPDSAAPNYYAYVESPIGLVEIGGTAVAITSLYFVERRREGAERNPTVDKAVRQVEAYFAGTRKSFDLRLDLRGTAFQRRVWEQLLRTPYGTTVAYRDIAEAIGRPKAVRAVGAANGRNPVSIIVPCHRVIGSDGSLTGYGGELWRKAWLLKHEGARQGGA
jgi:methylated-DNA-[protein]-cysteine S-methyltransferase